MPFAAYMAAAIHLAALCTPELPGLAPGYMWLELARVALLAVGVTSGGVLIVAGVRYP